MSENCCSSCCSQSADNTAENVEVSEAWDAVSLFDVPGMDCPAEEQMVRTALAELTPPPGFEFDLNRRQMRIYHAKSQLEEISHRLDGLGLGSRLLETGTLTDEARLLMQESAAARDAREARVLTWLLAINGLMFVLEFVVGWLAQSTGLIADSLDMFADAAVYGLALYAVGRSARLKVRAAHLAGWLQLALALFALSEVVRRFIFGSEPVSTLMIGMGLVALVANVASLMIISKSRDSGAHMKASWIFSANDVMANLGVIVAGVLVMWTGSRWPDLIIGTLIALVVLNGARKILQLKG